MNDEPDEYELALRARSGDLDALAELVARTRLRLFALAYAELRHYDDAHDAVASALLQICRHIGELREPERVREWMQSIVRNEVRRLRRGPSAPTLRLEEANGQSEGAIPSLLRLDIERAIRLYYLAGLSVAEIARLAGRPDGTVKSWLHRGRQHLALGMEGYAPMTPTPTAAETPAQTAALIHTDLEPTLVQKVTDALRTAGYATKILSPTDPTLLVDSLKEYQAVILDEPISGRSAFEYLMHVKSRADLKEIPVGVLCSNPSDFTVSAFFTAGVTRLVNKEDPADINKLAQPFEKPRPDLWPLFTEKARRNIYFAEEEAARLGDHYVGTEHLLLGLLRMPDSVGAQILERVGISLDSIKEETLQHVTRSTGNLGVEMQLTPRAKKVVDLACDEARLLNNNHIGTEHLLLGMIGEGDALAARVLTKLGADLERTRKEVWAMQAG